MTQDTASIAINAKITNQSRRSWHGNARWSSSAVIYDRPGIGFAAGFFRRVHASLGDISSKLEE